MELKLEALEAAASEDERAAQQASTEAVRSFERRRLSRRPFPDHLPRERVVIAAPADLPVLRHACNSRPVRDRAWHQRLLCSRAPERSTGAERFPCRRFGELVARSAIPIVALSRRCRADRLHASKAPQGALGCVIREANSSVIEKRAKDGQRSCWCRPGSEVWPLHASASTLRHDPSERASQAVLDLELSRVVGQRV